MRIRIKRNDLSDAIKLMHRGNYIGKLNHYYDPKTQHGYSARLYLKNKLKKLFNTKNIRTKMIGYAKHVPYVFKKTRKDEKGKRNILLYNPKTQCTSRCIKQLTRYNKLLRSSIVTHASHNIRCYPLRLYRSFTQDWEHGGRFYGGFWIHLNEQERRGIRINGNSVVELDYKNLHPSMLYDIEHIKFSEGDLY